MKPEQIGLILKRFNKPDEIRRMEKGTFEIVHIGGHDHWQSDLSARVEIV